MRKKRRHSDNDLLPEYDFSSAVRGKYCGVPRSGRRVGISRLGIGQPRFAAPGFDRRCKGRPVSDRSHWARVTGSAAKGEASLDIGLDSPLITIHAGRPRK
jgi:hypothetical protein